MNKLLINQQNLDASDKSEQLIEIIDLAEFRSALWDQPPVVLPCNSLIIIYVEEGGGYYRYEQKQVRIISNTFYCLYPGQLPLLRNCSLAKGYVLLMTEKFIYSFKDCLTLIHNSALFTLHGVQAISVNAVVKDKFDFLVNSLAQELTQGGAMKLDLIGALVKIVLIQLIRNKPEGNPETRNNSRTILIMNQFIELVDKNFQSAKKVSFYSSKMFITPNYLNNIVKRTTGYPASCYIQQRIVVEAKWQAFRSHRSMKEISSELGFDDQSHFSKFFKKNAGINFSHYQREHYKSA